MKKKKVIDWLGWILGQSQESCTQFFATNVKLYVANYNHADMCPAHRMELRLHDNRRLMRI